MRIRPRTAEEALATYQALRALHPDAHCELDHATPFQLLCATVMSAQTTDVAVNRATPALFAKFPDAATLALADPETDVEPLISMIGMFRQKAKNIVRLAKILIEKHGGEVPKTLAALVELPGVGRKTANVVLGVCFGTPEGVVVDTHVQRISQRLGFTTQDDPSTIEQDLSKLFPREHWDLLSHTLIFHGRRVCDAQRPKCETCTVSAHCPAAGAEASAIGRKPPSSRTKHATTARDVGKTDAKKTSRPASKVAKKNAFVATSAPSPASRRDAFSDPESRRAETTARKPAPLATKPPKRSP